MLDTNAISDLVINPSGLVARRLGEVGETNVFTSILVSAELAYGVKKRGSDELARKVGNVIGRILVVSLDPPADSAYADIRVLLHRLGTPIGPNDLWIAAHARALDATLVTANEREFSCVPGLKTENWLRA
jgi:tRNA(fMet)-specific endonuclease VapC